MTGFNIPPLAVDYDSRWVEVDLDGDLNGLAKRAALVRVGLGSQDPGPGHRRAGLQPGAARAARVGGALDCPSSGRCLGAARRWQGYWTGPGTCSGPLARSSAGPVAAPGIDVNSVADTVVRSRHCTGRRLGGKRQPFRVAGRVVGTRTGGGVGQEAEFREFFASQYQRCAGWGTG
jgi:hypothetical protein